MMLAAASIDPPPSAVTMSGNGMYTTFTSSKAMLFLRSTAPSVYSPPPGGPVDRDRAAAQVGEAADLAAVPQGFAHEHGLPVPPPRGRLGVAGGDDRHGHAAAERVEGAGGDGAAPDVDLAGGQRLEDDSGVLGALLSTSMPCSRK